MEEFPAHLFNMDGDPAAISASAAKWSGFGTAASTAASELGGVDTTQFVGPEGDLFREGLQGDMPGHLRITGDAFGRVSTALHDFAVRLASLQDQMRPEAQRAPGLWQALQAAQGRADQAKTADEKHQRDLANQPATADTSQPDPYRSDAGPAGIALSNAQREWQDCVNAANGLRTQLVTAVAASVREIRTAKDMRFKENPKWYDIGGQFTDFVRDNKDLLKKLSGALKIVSLVAGLLSFIPILAPICGPIAIGTALLASAIDLSIYAATGEGNLKTILIDIGLNLLPFAGKAVQALRRVGEVGEVAYGSTKLSKAVMNARAGLTNPLSGKNAAIFEYLQNGKRVLSDVGFSKLGTHAEREIWQSLEKLGVKPGDIKAIYSEFEPCITPTEAAGCKTFIAKMFPDAKVSWSWEYGDQASRIRGKAAKLAELTKLFSGVFK